MKFSASFSGGKDSTLAIKRMLDQGNDLVALIVSTKKGEDMSWTHNLARKYFEDIGQILDCQVLFTEAGLEDYEDLFEGALKASKELGAQACVFGDIDIQDHLDWNRARCKEAGITCIHPLECEGREAVLEEFLNTGLEARIIKVNKTFLDESIVGRVLDKDLVVELKSNKSIDPCGENGEYHTRIEVWSVEKYLKKIAKYT